ncbi:MAG TPA: hypothetical protein ENK24_07430 [Anaerolineae bacterium]|nr:hypothetical protein [Anaerolineae bacterium]
MLIALLIVVSACGPRSTPSPPAPEANARPAASAAAPTDTPVVEDNAAPPTMASCNAWLQQTHSLDYPGHGCSEHADILRAVKDDGGSVIPLQDDKFFIARFPDNWDALNKRTLIVTLHGSGGCAERLYQWWFIKISTLHALLLPTFRR